MGPLTADALGRRVTALRADPAVATLEGFHAVKHALRFGAEIELAVATDPQAVDALAAVLAPDVRERMRALIRPAPRASLAAQERPRAPDVLAFARRRQSRLQDVRADRPVVALENPRHLGNIGAVIRVAAAAGAAAVLSTGDRDPWDVAAIRGSAGLHYALPVLTVDAISPVATGERPLVAIDPDGDLLLASALPPAAVLAFGTERHGLSAATLDRAHLRVRIPMRPGVSSLNLATAVAVVLYALGDPSCSTDR